MCKLSTFVDSGVNEEGGGGEEGPPGVGTDIPLQPVAKTMVSESLSCGSWRFTVEKKSISSLGGPTLEQEDA